MIPNPSLNNLQFLIPNYQPFHSFLIRYAYRIKYRRVSLSQSAIRNLQSTIGIFVSPFVPQKRNLSPSRDTIPAGPPPPIWKPLPLLTNHQSNTQSSIPTPPIRSAKIFQKVTLTRSHRSAYPQLPREPIPLSRAASRRGKCVLHLGRVPVGQEAPRYGGGVENHSFLFVPRNEYLVTVCPLFPILNHQSPIIIPKSPILNFPSFP